MSLSDFAESSELIPELFALILSDRQWYYDFRSASPLKYTCTPESSDPIPEPFCPNQLALSRTGIYRHSWQDLVRATRKIRHANEPVVHNKHQPCNSNCLQCPIYALRACNPVVKTSFFLRQKNKSW